MTETQDFPTDAVVSAITGVLIVEDIGEVYKVCAYAAGEPVWTHQLPRVGRELQTVMMLRPELASLPTESGAVNPDNWRDWRDGLIRRLGPTLAVPRLKSAEHERIDPLSELAERAHPDDIIIADIG